MENNTKTNPEVTQDQITDSETAKGQTTPAELLKMALELKGSLTQDLYPGLAAGVVTMMELLKEVFKHEQLITGLLNDAISMLPPAGEKIEGRKDANQ